MKTPLLAATVVAGFATGAFAADIPNYVPPPTTPLPPAAAAPTVYDWSGIYAGVHGGYAFGDTFVTLLDDVESDANGFIAGGQVGYNIQHGNWVFGIEADAAWSGVDNQNDFDDLGLDGLVELDWLGTVRGRVGPTFDRLLLYGTGGVAFGGVTFTDFDAGGASESNTHVGWTVGAGAEYAVTDNVSVMTEYQYIDLGSEEYAVGTPDTVSLDAHVAKIGLNYRY